MTNPDRSGPVQAVCADIGSTYTKAALVDLRDGRLVATAEHRTTIDTDVLTGLDAAVAATGANDEAAWYVCSSAGGGLRLAVIGHEQLITAEAGRQVALTAGARVVHTSAGRLDQHTTAALRTARPDVLLLVGGTDGGEADTIVHNAQRLATARLRRPVVVAGNVEAREQVVALLAARHIPVSATANVLPRIGVMNPTPARTAIRQMFLRHVIGGKRLSRGPRLPRLLRCATPDAVLAAVELLATTIDGDLLVVDVGGATTDVYSSVDAHRGEPADTAAASADAVGSLHHARTVEGDLGMRWSAPSVLPAALAERLLDQATAAALRQAADDRAASPQWVPTTATDRAQEQHLARLSATVALRRHARGEPDSPRRGRNLHRVRLVVGSGGILRHLPTAEARATLAAAVDDPEGGWALPRAAAVAVDHDYILAAAGMLASEHPHAAALMLRRLAESGD